MDQEIIMMLRYPACLGFLNEEELDRAFDAIRWVRSYSCTIIAVHLYENCILLS